MKKSFLSLLSLILAITLFACGCNDSRYVKKFERKYSISLPKKTELVYKYVSGFEDKVEYYVYDVSDNGYTLTINSRFGEKYEKAKANGLDLSEWESIDFKSSVIDTLKYLKIDETYYPDLDSEFEWIFRPRDFFVLYYPSERRMIIYSFIP